MKTPKPRIVFLVMSAVNRADVVDQLARSLAPHAVLVHHDFSQTPEFELQAANARFVPNPKRTGWAFFGFVDGIFHSLQHALESLDFDYLQLLSPTCLPIKPIGAFEQRVGGSAEAHFECVDLLADRDALMSVGYRAFTPERSLRHRVARRLSREYFGTSTGRRNLAGIWLRSGFATNAAGRMTLVARAALAATTMLSRPSIGRHIFDEDFRPHYGTTWFGAKRHVVEQLTRSFARPGLREYFSRLRIADEFLIPTLLKQSGAQAGPMNHYIHTFEEAHTGWLQEADIDLLRSCPAFFARKFPDDPGAMVRHRVLDELVEISRPAIRPVALGAVC
ncbi:MAG: hypothetical protein M9885_12940 [Burkholderiaceae bacterium]|nr:hypothetical protein [Burkholderiaceae bacterium]